jgi:hypothetical protein
MKVKKKLVALCIVALVIGMVVMLPTVYFTGNNLMAAGESWFNVDIPYAYIDLYDTGENAITSWDGAFITVVSNFTLTPAAIELKGVDAHIEFYMFHVYSEQGSIVNLSYSVAVSRGVKWVPGEPLIDVGITGSGNNCYNFADGTMFDGNIVLGDNHQCCGATCKYIISGEPVEEFVYTSADAFIGDDGGEGEKTMDALAVLRNAQTIYIEVSRVCSVSYQESSQNDSSSTKVTLVNDEGLGYIDLTRIDEGFICGEYKKGSLPGPIREPTSASLILQLLPIYKLKSFVPTCALQSIAPLGKAIVIRGS